MTRPRLVAECRIDPNTYETYEPSEPSRITPEVVVHVECSIVDTQHALLALDAAVANVRRQLMVFDPDPRVAVGGRDGAVDE